jgi:hypothetical protein
MEAEKSGGNQYQFLIQSVIEVFWSDKIPHTVMSYPSRKRFTMVGSPVGAAPHQRLAQSTSVA